MIRYFLEKRKIVYGILIGLMFFSYLTSYAISSICIGVLAVFFFIDSKKNILNKLRSIRKDHIAILYLLFFLIQCIGLLYTSNLERGLRELTILLPVVFLPAILITEPMDKQVFRRIFEILKYWIALIFVFLIAIHIFVDDRDLSSFVLYSINEKLGISQFYTVFILLIVILHCIQKIENKEGTVLNLVFLFFFIFCVFLLGNKTSLLMLAILITLKFSLILRKRAILHKILMCVCVCFIFSALVFFVPGVKKKINLITRTTDFDIETIITKNSVTFTSNTLEHRILMNYISVREIKEHFPFGVGTGSNQDILDKNYKEINFKSGIKQRFNNHNQYLAEFLKTGILGGGCYILLLLCLFKRASLTNDYYIYLVLSFAIGCLFESYLERQHGVIIFSFIIPFFLMYEDKIS